jgi:hypothetical protein
MVSDGSSGLGYETLISVRRRVTSSIRLRANHVARRSPRYVVLESHEQRSTADLTVFSRDVCMIQSYLSYSPNIAYQSNMLTMRRCEHHMSIPTNEQEVSGNGR